MQISNRLGLELDKQVVKQVLDKYCPPTHDDGDPSWLAFFGHTKDSLWSVDLFRVESIVLETHWVMVVMDSFTRGIIGFSVQAGCLDGISLCCLFNKIVAKKRLPVHLSSDHDPLYTFHRWQANVRVLSIKEIKAVPYVPLSHPYIERCIGTIRREYLDRLFFWDEVDLQHKLNRFKDYYNTERVHASLRCLTPSERSKKRKNRLITMDNYRWRNHCKNLFQLPEAA